MSPVNRAYVNAQTRMLSWYPTVVVASRELTLPQRHISEEAWFRHADGPFHPVPIKRQPRCLCRLAFSTSPATAQRLISHNLPHAH